MRGTPYMAMGALHLPTGQTPKFAQIYIYDRAKDQNAVDIRIAPCD
ncbi:MAG: hypothetical protein ACREBR_00055 [bacterium]